MPNWVKNVNWQERGKNQKLRRVHTRPSCLQCGGLKKSVTILNLAPKWDSTKQKGIFTIDDPLISKFTRFTSRFVGLLGLRVNLDVFQQLKRWRRRGRMANWCGEKDGILKRMPPEVKMDYMELQRSTVIKEIKRDLGSKWGKSDRNAVKLGTMNLCVRKWSK